MSDIYKKLGDLPIGSVIEFDGVSVKVISTTVPLWKIPNGAKIKINDHIAIVGGQYNRVSPDTLLFFPEKTGKSNIIQSNVTELCFQKALATPHFLVGTAQACAATATAEILELADPDPKVAEQFKTFAVGATIKVRVFDAQIIAHDPYGQRVLWHDPSGMVGHNIVSNRDQFAELSKRYDFDASKYTTGSFGWKEVSELTETVIPKNAKSIASSQKVRTQFGEVSCLGLSKDQNYVLTISSDQDDEAHKLSSFTLDDASILTLYKHHNLFLPEDAKNLTAVWRKREDIRIDCKIDKHENYTIVLHPNKHKCGFYIDDGNISHVKKLYNIDLSSFKGTVGEWKLKTATPLTEAKPKLVALSKVQPGSKVNINSDNEEVTIVGFGKDIYNQFVLVRSDKKNKATNLKFEALHPIWKELIESKKLDKQAFFDYYPFNWQVEVIAPPAPEKTETKTMKLADVPPYSLVKYQGVEVTVAGHKERNTILTAPIQHEKIFLKFAYNDIHHSWTSAIDLETINKDNYFVVVSDNNQCEPVVLVDNSKVSVANTSSLLTTDKTSATVKLSEVQPGSKIKYNGTDATLVGFGKTMSDHCLITTDVKTASDIDYEFEVILPEWKALAESAKIDKSNYFLAVPITSKCEFISPPQKNVVDKKKLSDVPEGSTIKYNDQEYTVVGRRTDVKNHILIARKIIDNKKIDKKYFFGSLQENREVEVLSPLKLSEEKMQAKDIAANKSVTLDKVPAGASFKYRDKEYKVVGNIPYSRNNILFVSKTSEIDACISFYGLSVENQEMVSAAKVDKNGYFGSLHQSTAVEMIDAPSITVEKKTVSVGELPSGTVFRFDGRSYAVIGEVPFSKSNILISAMDQYGFVTYKFDHIAVQNKQLVEDKKASKEGFFGTINTSVQVEVVSYPTKKNSTLLPGTKIEWSGKEFIVVGNFHEDKSTLLACVARSNIGVPFDELGVGCKGLAEKAAYDKEAKFISLDSNHIVEVISEPQSEEVEIEKLPIGSIVKLSDGAEVTTLAKNNTLTLVKVNNSCDPKFFFQYKDIWTEKSKEIFEALNLSEKEKQESYFRWVHSTDKVQVIAKPAEIKNNIMVDKDCSTPNVGTYGNISPTMKSKTKDDLMTAISQMSADDRLILHDKISKLLSAETKNKIEEKSLSNLKKLSEVEVGSKVKFTYNSVNYECVVVKSSDRSKLLATKSHGSFFIAPFNKHKDDADIKHAAQMFPDQLDGKIGWIAGHNIVEVLEAPQFSSAPVSIKDVPIGTKFKACVNSRDGKLPDGGSKDQDGPAIIATYIGHDIVAWEGLTPLGYKGSPYKFDHLKKDHPELYEKFKNGFVWHVVPGMKVYPENKLSNMAAENKLDKMTTENKVKQDLSVGDVVFVPILKDNHIAINEAQIQTHGSSGKNITATVIRNDDVEYLIALRDGEPSHSDFWEISKSYKEKYNIPSEFTKAYWISKSLPVSINKKGKLKMENSSFLDMVKVDAKSAAYRVASTQMTKGTKAAIVSILQKQGHGSDRIQAISEVLDTEFGTALISLLLGAGLTYVPMLSEDPRAQKLATEFRIGGMATAGNAVIGVALEHFLPVITTALSALPQEEARKALPDVQQNLTVEPAPLVEQILNKTQAAAG